MTEQDEHLRFPVGRFKPESNIPAQQRAEWLNEIEELPRHLRTSISGLSEEQLDTPYRLGGWTIRQVVHHLPDSHINSYQRFRLALTEPVPEIRPYHEELWAELPDAKLGSPELSLPLLEALHRRWIVLLRSLTDDDFSRTLRHRELGEVRLDWMLGLYAWHGRHHLAHINNLRTRQGW